MRRVVADIMKASGAKRPCSMCSTSDPATWRLASEFRYDNCSTDGLRSACRKCRRPMEKEGTKAFLLRRAARKKEMDKVKQDRPRLARRKLLRLCEAFFFLGIRPDRRILDILMKRRRLELFPFLPRIGFYVLMKTGFVAIRTRDLIAYQKTLYEKRKEIRASFRLIAPPRRPYVPRRLATSASASTCRPPTSCRSSAAAPGASPCPR
jgi:hypothetical protein